MYIVVGRGTLLEAMNEEKVIADEQVYRHWGYEYCPSKNMIFS